MPSKPPYSSTTATRCFVVSAMNLIEKLVPLHATPARSRSGLRESRLQRLRSVSPLLHGDETRPCRAPCRRSRRGSPLLEQRQPGVHPLLASYLAAPRTTRHARPAGSRPPYAASSGPAAVTESSCSAFSTQPELLRSAATPPLRRAIPRQHEDLLDRSAPRIVLRFVRQAGASAPASPRAMGHDTQIIPCSRPCRCRAPGAFAKRTPRLFGHDLAHDDQRP